MHGSDKLKAADPAMICSIRSSIGFFMLPHLLLAAIDNRDLVLQHTRLNFFHLLCNQVAAFSVLWECNEALEWRPASAQPDAVVVPILSADTAIATGPVRYNRTSINSSESVFVRAARGAIV